MAEDAGIVLVRESFRDDSMTRRCMCCDPRRKLVQIRNDPRSQVAVCPATRLAFILDDRRLVISTGYYTGSLDGC